MHVRVEYLSYVEARCVVTLVLGVSPGRTRTRTLVRVLALVLVLSMEPAQKLVQIGMGETRRVLRVPTICGGTRSTEFPIREMGLGRNIISSFLPTCLTTVECSVIGLSFLVRNRTLLVPADLRREVAVALGGRFLLIRQATWLSFSLPLNTSRAPQDIPPKTNRLFELDKPEELKTVTGKGQKTRPKYPSNPKSWE